jgi:hypothetical protein
MSRLALFLLGPPRIELDGEPIHIARRRAVALLAYLAVTAGSHSRDSLATLLWPEYDQSRARAALRRTLSELNSALGWGMVDDRSGDRWAESRCGSMAGRGRVPRPIGGPRDPRLPADRGLPRVPPAPGGLSSLILPMR